MFKSNGGFTLVELIVVIAILAILAGVGLPVYTGYIEKAKSVAGQVSGHESSVNSEAAKVWKDATGKEWSVDTP